MRGRPAEADLQAERSIYRSIRRTMEHNKGSMQLKSPKKVVLVLFDRVTCGLHKTNDLKLSYVMFIFMTFISIYSINLITGVICSYVSTYVNSLILTQSMVLHLVVS